MESAAFIGKWQQVNRTNVPELVASLGIPEEKRAKVCENMMTMTLEVTRDGDGLKMVTTTPAATREIRAKHGEPFDYVTSVGKTLKCTATMDGDQKMKQILSDPEKGVDVGCICSEVTGDEMTATFTIGAVSSVSTFKRI